MILIPEIRTVVILPPRTGSRTLIRMVIDRYPEALMIYRHMEADGVPHGYDAWPRVGLVRPPLQRMWSLYKFLREFGVTHHTGDRPPSDTFTGGTATDAAFKAAMRGQADRPFEDWLLNNERPFTNGYSHADPSVTIPMFSVLHSIPENRKSQWRYLRPDLGTEVYDFRRHDLFARDRLGLEVGRVHNRSSEEPMPRPSAAMADHAERYFAWELGFCGEL